ncbi:MAG: response regulator transcription factor [Chloroflexota bacterium]|nr:response regulator transcription factor [Chloroflexota bacterium]
MLAFFLASVSDLEVVGTVSPADPSILGAGTTPTDVVLVSYPLLQSDGERLLAALRKANSDVKSIVLTPDPDDETLAICFDAPTAGYVSKDMAASELVDRIKRAHAGELLWSSAELIRIMEYKRPRPASVRASLARREIEVLQTLVTGASTDEVAERLNITSHTVRTHVKNAMSKLGANSKLEAVVIALRAGLISLSD